MPFLSKRARLRRSDEDRGWLSQVAQSRTEAVARVQRAQMLLRYTQGETLSAMAQALHTNRPRVERCVSKALDLGVGAALRDLPGRGRRRSITGEDQTWVVDLACQKPKDLGYAQELWTTRLLAKHVRTHCGEAGHPQLRKLGRGTVSKISDSAPYRCWPGSICSKARCWVWCGIVMAARSSSSFSSWRIATIPRDLAFAWS